MEIFKFHNPNNETLLEQGEAINGIDEIMWVERYRDAGEFTLKASVDANLRVQLPLGTLISHTNSSDVMIVESHEISEDKGRTPDIVVTGRSFETFLENRIVHQQTAHPANVVEYTLAPEYIWNQAVMLIRDHTYTSYDPNDAIQAFYTTTTVTGTGVVEARPVRRGSVYSALIELLAVDSLGIKVIRPGPYSPFGPNDLTTAILVHKGVDRTADVVFSYDSGDIDNSDYLWSLKSLKTSVVVTGKWIEVIFNGPEIAYDRRIMYVDGTIVDQDFTTPPINQDAQNVVAAMTTLGKQALAAKKELALSKAQASREVRRYEYRKDYEVGDIVTVAGDYDETARMRVIEYVEIEDSSGESGYPTLSKL